MKKYKPKYYMEANPKPKSKPKRSPKEREDDLEERISDLKDMLSDVKKKVGGAKDKDKKNELSLRATLIQHLINLLELRIEITDIDVQIEDEEEKRRNLNYKKKKLGALGSKDKKDRINSDLKSSIEEQKELEMERSYIIDKKLAGIAKKAQDDLKKYQNLVDKNKKDKEAAKDKVVKISDKKKK